MNPAAQEQVRAWARRGRIDGAAEPQIRLEAPGNALRGQEVAISWRVQFAERAVLRVRTPDGRSADEVAPLVGRRSFRFASVGRHRIEIVATPHASRARRRRPPQIRGADIEVAAPTPVVQLDAPRRITLGDVARVAWRTAEADETHLLIDGDPRAVEAEGALDLLLTPCGRHTVSIIARGEGGCGRHNIYVEVAAPAVCIDAPSEVSALLGELAPIRYSIAGARGAWLDELDQGVPPYPIPLTGRIEVPATLNPERLRIIADGHDGHRVHKTITVTARLFDPVNIDPEIDRLNRWLG